MLTKTELDQITEFLVYSEYTATENERTDCLCEIDLSEVTLEYWTECLVSTMIEIDHFMNFDITDCDQIVKELLSDPECNEILNDKLENLIYELEDID